jgi:hypothetical protein
MNANAIVGSTLVEQSECFPYWIFESPLLARFFYQGLSGFQQKAFG